MSAISAIKDVWLKKAINLGFQVVGTLMNTSYPREFELLSLTLELVDFDGTTQNMITFPIMPENLKVEEGTAATVTTTFGGVSVLKSQGFIPKKISLSGSFGVNLKMISQFKLPSFFGKVDWERDYGNGEPNKGGELSDSVKSGYGVCKLLQMIINNSFAVNDKGQPNSLILYNMAFGESYVVVPAGPPQFSQDMRSNTIWNYQLDLIAVCPLHLYRHKNGNLAQAYANTAIQFTLNNTTKAIRQTLSAANVPVNI